TFPPVSMGTSTLHPFPPRRGPSMRWIVGSCRALVAAALFTLLCTGVARAQGVTTGAISGKVTDKQGQPVGEAAVQVTNRGSGFTTSVRSRSNGQYLVQG